MNEQQFCYKTIFKEIKNLLSPEHVEIQRNYKQNFELESSINVVTRLFDVDLYPVEREDNRSIFTLCRERPRSILNSSRNIYAHKASRPVSFWSCFQLIREMKAVRE